MTNLIKKLRSVPDAYDDFVLGVICYAKKSPEHINLINDFIGDDRNILTSDVVEFIINQPDFQKCCAEKRKVG